MPNSRLGNLKLPSGSANQVHVMFTPQDVFDAPGLERPGLDQPPFALPYVTFSCLYISRPGRVRCINCPFHFVNHESYAGVFGRQRRHCVCGGVCRYATLYALHATRHYAQAGDARLCAGARVGPARVKCTKCVRALAILLR